MVSGLAGTPVRLTSLLNLLAKYKGAGKRVEVGEAQECRHNQTTDFARSRLISFSSSELE